MTTNQNGQPVAALENDPLQISCPICQAVYTPAPAYLHLLQTSSFALESAFMSMCHFCFRCRRPACPSCWDNIHGLCGLCTLEAGLAFRSFDPPLPGSPRYRSISAELNLKTAPRLQCIQPGRLQDDIVPSERVTTIPLRALARQRATRRNPSPNRTDIDQITTRPDPHLEQAERPTRPDPHPEQVRLPTRPERSHIPTRGKTRHTTQSLQRPEQQLHHPDKPELPTHSVHAPLAQQEPRSDKRQREYELATRPGRESSARLPAHTRSKAMQAHQEAARFYTQLERIASALLLGFSGLLIILITSAVASPDVNAAIIQLLHLDIRGELAYLWHLLRLLHL
ncbi:hypothetical protein [Tengunoibacter tsumagoiensis]|uniref:Uncharacterized protein n=1 Tax=Tengunoibacter tsumagoiensis TaxID=2014871 RepID=A0A402A3M1_9CHLR|nr:hypothetical protein [Tengunoibacter tsumagoiensis]GCE13591.1 hypothetical protein KTT_34500 [Tengunoibacter tsumagoiensis]